MPLPCQLGLLAPMFGSATALGRLQPAATVDPTSGLLITVTATLTTYMELPPGSSFNPTGSQLECTVIWPEDTGIGLVRGVPSPVRAIPYFLNRGERGSSD